MLKRSICFLLIPSLLFAFAIPVSAAGIYQIHAKEREKKLIELWNGDDREALEEYFDENYSEDGGFSPHLFDPEDEKAFRSGEDRLLIVDFDFDREAMLASEYGEFFLEEEKEDPDNLGSFYFSAVMYDGTVYATDRKNAYDRRVYSFSEIVGECGIVDPEEIGMIRFERLSWRGMFYYDFTDYTPGWNEIGGDRYYIKPGGKIITKPATIDGIRYKFGENGVCEGRYTGFTDSNKGRRYWKNGKLVKNKWLRVKGERKYYADADGYFVTGTRAIGGKEYFFAENGVLQTEEFPRIGVEFSDGTVYESTDGGTNWTKDGQEAIPPLYARFEGESPVYPSKKASIVIGHEFSTTLHTQDDWLLREENGEWVSAELFDQEAVVADLAVVIEKNKEARFSIFTDLYAPLAGKYRYTMALGDEEGNDYRILVDFRMAEEMTAER